MAFTRRTLLQNAPAIVLGATCIEWSTGCANAPQEENSSPELFRHGVASGDPLADAVILWTRVTPLQSTDESVPVQWQLATDADMGNVVAEGVFSTGPDRDYTVKVDAMGLKAGTEYYYRFRALSQASPVGRTCTSPTGAVERLRIAAVSCANYPAGYFHAYRNIAERTDLDFVLHLGDYLYEYEDGYFGLGEPLNRAPSPNRELVSLADYRQRHAQYKTDSDLQLAHRRLPFIAIWDDHEISNDSYRGGAQNHQAFTEGSYELRKAAAVQAYFEWMPIRELSVEGESKIFRRFDYGDLMQLLTLDTRLAGRDRQVVDRCDIESITDPNRSILGEAQEQWLLSELRSFKDSHVRWCILGQQVMMGQLSDLAKGCLADPDQWDGYEESRRRVLSELESGAIDNVVILTGDAHSSWAIDIAKTPFDTGSYNSETGLGSLAVEFVVPGITSAGPGGNSTQIRDDNPHVKFREATQQGYLVLDITPEKAEAQWYFMDDTRSTVGGGERLAASYLTRNSQNRVEPGS